MTATRIAPRPRRRFAAFLIAVYSLSDRYL